jgi:hypothetical protein
LSSGDNLLLVNTYLAKPTWSDKGPPLTMPLAWGEFKAADREKFDALLDAGENYGSTYVAYRTYPGIFGSIVMANPEPMYKLVPKSHMSGMKLTQIYMTPTSALAKAVDKLEANDIVQYGAFAEFIVRRPGDIRILEITSDNVSKPYDSQVFTARLVCEITSKSTLARLKEEAGTGD